MQYRERRVDYQRVLDSQRFLATQEDRLTEVSGQVSTDLVATYKALGGGWQIRKGEEIVSAENRNEMIGRRTENVIFATTRDTAMKIALGKAKDGGNGTCVAIDWDRHADKGIKFDNIKGFENVGGRLMERNNW